MADANPTAPNPSTESPRLAMLAAVRDNLRIRDAEDEATFQLAGASCVASLVLRAFENAENLDVNRAFHGLRWLAAQIEDAAENAIALRERRLPVFSTTQPEDVQSGFAELARLAAEHGAPPLG